MARKPVIGHITCTVCGFNDMEIREDKNGHPAAWCPDCNAQSLTHGGFRAQKMRERMRPVSSVSDTGGKPEPVAVTEPNREPEPQPKQKGNSLLSALGIEA